VNYGLRRGVFGEITVKSKLLKLFFKRRRHNTTDFGARRTSISNNVSPIFNSTLYFPSILRPLGALLLLADVFCAIALAGIMLGCHLLLRHAPPAPRVPAERALVSRATAQDYNIAPFRCGFLWPFVDFAAENFGEYAADEIFPVSVIELIINAVDGVSAGGERVFTGHVAQGHILRPMVSVGSASVMNLTLYSPNA
jgi:hypothetical protein